MLIFALLPNRANGEELFNMVQLILNPKQSSTQNTHSSVSMRSARSPNIVALATLDNQTPLARALCHPAVTAELVTLLNKQDWITDKQLLIAFDLVARHRRDPEKPYDYLKPLENRLKEAYKNQSDLRQIPHLICRHNNSPLLSWFYENIIEVSTQTRLMHFRKNLQKNEFFSRSHCRVLNQNRSISIKLIMLDIRHC